jgi:hypothetical protein
MKRITARNLLTWLFPLALFLAGMASAWAWDGDELGDLGGDQNCCCCKNTDGSPNGPLPKGGEPVGPCDMPKSDCGCDNSAPLAENVLRVAKPGRLSEDHDFAPVSAPAERRIASFGQASGLASAHSPEVSSPEHYLHNRSLRC